VALTQRSGEIASKAEDQRRPAGQKDHGKQENRLSPVPGAPLGGSRKMRDILLTNY
jgi:hypothetical protein